MAVMLVVVVVMSKPIWSWTALFHFQLNLSTPTLLEEAILIFKIAETCLFFIRSTILQAFDAETVNYIR